MTAAYVRRVYSGVETEWEEARADGDNEDVPSVFRDAGVPRRGGSYSTN